jgi:uncharacterized protein (TIGR02145 family)
MRNTKVILSLVLFISMASTVVRAQTVTDIDGNVYKTVTIFREVWMMENLKTTRYNDSTRIPLVIDNEAWREATPAYCWYENFEYANKNTYGALYNWYAINTNKLCPTGWHVSTKKEWNHLLDHLGPMQAGWALKERGTTHWRAPNAGVTNSSGFTALPGGYRRSNGVFYGIGLMGYFWAAPGNFTVIPWYQGWKLSWGYYSQVECANFHKKRVGLSVRCIKDK